MTLDEDFVSDTGFNIEKYLTEKFGKCFGKAEDNAFVNGTGEDEPTGILHDRNGVWLMNDGTALALRKLRIWGCDMACENGQV